MAYGPGGIWIDQGEDPRDLDDLTAEEFEPRRCECGSERPPRVDRWNDEWDDGEVYHVDKYKCSGCGREWEEATATGERVVGPVPPWRDRGLVKNEAGEWVCFLAMF